MIVGSLLALLVIAEQASEAPSSCPAPDREAAVLRDWADFEFSTTSEGGPMWYAMRGCHARAAEISLEYLARGPLLSVRQQAITQLHRGRNLAFAGDEASAAQAVASARRSDQVLAGPTALDWNAYVEGLYGFLVKDRALLDDRLARLRTLAGDGNAMNADNLARLFNCFDRPYAEAQTASECAAP